MAKGIMAGGGISFLRGLTATPSDIVSGYTFLGASKKKEDGSIPLKEAAIIMPGTEDVTLYSGQYLSGAQTIRGDQNLIPSNIRKGVTIFGVTGTFVPVNVIPMNPSTVPSVWTDVGTPYTDVTAGYDGNGLVFNQQASSYNSFIACFTLASPINFDDYNYMTIRGSAYGNYGVFNSNIGSTEIQVSTDGRTWQWYRPDGGDKGTASSDRKSISFNMVAASGIKYVYIRVYMAPYYSSNLSWITSVEFSQ